MTEIPLQLMNQCPACGFKFLHLIEIVLDSSRLAEFKLFQYLKSKLTGIKKERSLTQIGLYWAGCNFMAELLSEGANKFTGRDIDFQVKLRVADKKPAMIQHFEMYNGKLWIAPISIAFENLSHLNACNYFFIAWPIMAEMCGTDEETLVQEVKNNMKGRLL